VEVRVGGVGWPPKVRRERSEAVIENGAEANADNPKGGQMCTASTVRSQARMITAAIVEWRTLCYPLEMAMTPDRVLSGTGQSYSQARELIGCPGPVAESNSTSVDEHIRVLSYIEGMDSLTNEQRASESVLREISEVMLTVEAASSRVEQALRKLQSGELADDPGNPALAALQDTKAKLDVLRRNLHQKGYLAHQQNRLF
jgi:hypothetical protein